jgi:homopolymeric O-antigen transport system permease protein
MSQSGNTAATTEESFTLVIEAGRAERHYWADLWRYRELFYFLAWRDLLVRYKQTAIGVLWALLRPLLTIVALTLVFGKVAHLPSDGAPYPILVCAAMLPWQFFASAFADAGNSLTTNANLISKVYFPRLIVPASAVAVSAVDSLVSAVILVVLMLWYGVVPDRRALFLPLFALMAVGAALGAGVWVAALNVKYRDFRYIIPFIVQFGLFVSPVGFSSSVIPGEWRLLYSLNPLVGVIDGVRWALFGGTAQFYWPGFAMSLLSMLAVLWLGIRYFRKTERYFADVI